MNIINVGSIVKNNIGENAIITNILNSQEVKIKFLDNIGCEVYATAGNLRRGSFKNPFSRSFKGVGYIGIGPFNPYHPNKNGASYEYSKWRDMLTRCYDPKFHLRRPSYEMCIVNEQFHCLQNFGSWISNQIGYGKYQWHLDKDLIYKGNKEYHPEYCVLLPHEINALIEKSDASRGLYPIGVHYDKERDKYTAQCKIKNKRTNLGRFSTADEAFCVYKSNKELEIVRVANLWKEQIDPRAYQALMDYKVDIDD